MQFSAFLPFGQLRFSSRKPAGQVLYEDMVQNSGGETNISTEFDDSPVNAELYAEAMQLARAKATLEMAGEQYAPDRTVAMLPKQEWQFGLVPGPKDSIRTRQRAFAAAALMARGASRENVETVLRGLLGDDFVAVVLQDVASAAATGDPALIGNWNKPGSTKKVYRLRQNISTVGTPITVGIDYVAGEAGGFQTNEKVIVDVGDWNRTERVSVNQGSSGNFLATFTKPHNAGTLVAAGRVPNLGSTKRHTNVVLSSAAILNPEKRRIANRALRKLLRGVSTWSLVVESGAGLAGPIRIGSPSIGMSAIRALVY